MITQGFEFTTCFTKVRNNSVYFQVRIRQSGEKRGLGASDTVNYRYSIGESVHASKKTGV